MYVALMDQNVCKECSETYVALMEQNVCKECSEM